MSVCVCECCTGQLTLSCASTGLSHLININSSKLHEPNLLQPYQQRYPIRENNCPVLLGLFGLANGRARGLMESGVWQRWLVVLSVEPRYNYQGIRGVGGKESSHTSSCAAL